MEVAVLGLGEAGGRIAADLAAAGCVVRGWDPARRLDGIDNADERSRTRSGAPTSSSASTRRPSRSTRRPASPTRSAGDALYADLNTAAPQLKRELAAALPVQFADVALVGVVPEHGPARRPRSRPAPAPSASPSSSGRSGCPSRSSARTRATPPA